MSDGERFRMEVIRDEAVVADRQIVSGRSWSCPFDDLCCTHQAAITNIVCSVSRVLTIPAVTRLAHIQTSRHSCRPNSHNRRHLGADSESHFSKLSQDARTRHLRNGMSDWYSRKYL